MPTYKEQFNKKHGFSKEQDHSLEEISRLSGYKLEGLKTIFEKGKGAFYSNPTSVRPLVKRSGGAVRWGLARVYAAINPSSKASKVDGSHLVKRR